MLITEKFLVANRVAGRYVRWAVRNQLLPFDSASLKDIEGDENKFFHIISKILRGKTFTPEGLPKSFNKGDGFSWTKTYGKHGTLTRLENSNGQSMVHTYNEIGNKTKIVVTEDSIITKIIAMTYDHNGNLLSHDDSKNGSWTQSYDNLNRVVTFADSKGYSWTRTYDGDTNNYTEIDSNKLTRRIIFNSAGDVIEAVDQDGKTYSATYDDIGNIAHFEDSDGTSWNRTYTFYPNGQLQAVFKDGLAVLKLPELRK